MASKTKTIILFIDNWPEKEIIDLYKAGRWWTGLEEKNLVKKIISGSFVFAVAVDLKTNKAVGMGRVLSDGVSDAYIQDVVVLPEYRRQNIGKKIITALRDYCLKKKIEWIALIAEGGTEKFYSSLGFRKMRNHTPMKYIKEK